VSTPNILAKRSEEGPVPYCKTGAESDGNNQLGPLVSVPLLEMTYADFFMYLAKTFSPLRTLSQSRKVSRFIVLV
jgi:hypothetical protein